MKESGEIGDKFRAAAALNDRRPAPRKFYRPPVRRERTLTAAAGLKGNCTKESRPPGLAVERPLQRDYCRSGPLLVQNTGRSLEGARPNNVANPKTLTSSFLEPLDGERVVERSRRSS